MGTRQALDWGALESDLNANGCAVVKNLLSAADCVALRDLYACEDRFRSRVVMAKHGFGRGEYKYFRYPLPETVAEMRAGLYPPLADIANRWNESLRQQTQYPPAHEDYLKRCHDAGQTRPTPLLLQYGAGDYNCLHQDLYGELVF